MPVLALGLRWTPTVLRGLPVRGQRTQTNARTRKGPRKTVGVQRNPNAKTGIH